MNEANHFRPDQADEFPFTTEVELLQGGIGREMFPDGTLQFAVSGWRSHLPDQEIKSDKGKSVHDFLSGRNYP